MISSMSRPKCQKCGGSAAKTPDDFILTCASCGASYHAKKCLSYPDRLISLARTYNWMCGSCKRCEVCLRKRNERDLILCDVCDRGYHCFCLVPQLWKPPEGSWQCPNCTAGSKENVEDGGVMTSPLRSARNLRYGFHRASDAESADAASVDTAESDEPPSKRTRRHGLPQKSENGGTSAAPSPRNSSPTLATRKKRRSRSFAGTRPTKCPVNGCHSEGHLSGRFPRHVYREFCPVYHNINLEEAKALRRRREELQQLHKMPKRVDTQRQQTTLRTVDEERAKIECHLRKKPTTSSVMDGSATYSPRRAFDREPFLTQCVSKFDLDLFRMAQAELAERMERDASLRNTASSRNKWVRFGRYDIATWHLSQYPGEYAQLEKLFVCEYCLKFMRCEYQLRRHGLPGRCSLTHPPGDKIYEKGSLAVWEVNGINKKVYCQNLCLLAMLFLDHKTLFKDVEAFYFYILTLKDEKIDNTYHFVAYFSKEKTSTGNCNLSCLLTLPPFLRRGYGHFLIDMSYALSKLEGKIGSPEHPLSDMGLKTYRNYWKSKIFDWLIRQDKGETISIKDISQQTAIHQNDLISTLQYLGMVKYWRGQYWIVKTEAVSAYKKAMQKKKGDPLQAPREIDVSCLNWNRPQ